MRSLFKFISTLAPFLLTANAFANTLPSPLADGVGYVVQGFPFIGELSCPVNESLIRLGFAPAAAAAPADLRLSPPPMVLQGNMEADTNIPGADLGNITYQVRFDFCATHDAQLTLMRVILRKRGYYAFGRLQPDFHTLVPAANSPTAALGQGIAQGDYSQVFLRFDGSVDDRTPTYVIRGVGQSPNSYLLLSSHAVGSDGSTLLAPSEAGRQPTVNVGVPDAVDPFAEFEQPQSVVYQSATHSLSQGDLEFEFRYEVTFHGAGYRGYRYTFGTTGIRIRDRGPYVASPIEIVAAGPNTRDSFEYISSHHNLSDQFVFKDPTGKATYTLHPGANNDGRLVVEYRDEQGQLVRQLEYPILRQLRTPGEVDVAP